MKIRTVMGLGSWVVSLSPLLVLLAPRVGTRVSWRTTSGSPMLCSHPGASGGASPRGGSSSEGA